MTRIARYCDASIQRSVLKTAVVFVAFVHSLLPTHYQLSAEEKESRQNPQSQERKERLLKMRRIAESIRTASRNEEQEVPVELMTTPLFRFSDSARGYSDGTIWGWGKTGRPVAVFTVSRISNSVRGFKWLYELTSLSGNRVISESNEGWKWTPKEKNLELTSIPGSSPVADSPAQRLRQLKQLAHRFEADEFYQPKGQEKQEWYKLRLLPQPIHRYAKAGTDVQDGALFVFAYGTNPEILLEIVSVADSRRSRAWHYRCVRTSAAELRVRLGEDEVWHQPKIVSGDPEKQYFTTASKGNFDEKTN